jgi:hypothetical protein
MNQTLADKVVGVWKLKSFELETSSGQKIFPFGQDCQGLCIFTKERYMSAQGWRLDRPAFAINDSLRGTPEEIKASFEGYIAYCGTCSVNEEEGILTTIPEGSMFPNWIGVPQKRYVRAEGELLSLTTDPIPAGGETIVGRFLWERVKT